MSNDLAYLNHWTLLLLFTLKIGHPISSAWCRLTCPVQFSYQQICHSTPLHTSLLQFSSQVWWENWTNKQIFAMKEGNVENHGRNWVLSTFLVCCNTSVIKMCSLSSLVYLLAFSPNLFIVYSLFIVYL